MNPKGELEELEVNLRPASNIVRKELQKEEKILSIYQMQFSKDLQKDHKEIFELQKAKDGDFDQVMAAQDELTVEQFGIVTDLNEVLAEKQNDTLYKEMRIIIDVEKTIAKKGKMKNYQIAQLESLPNEYTTIPVESEDEEDLEFDFWNNQDLENLRMEKIKFFRKVGM